MCVHCVNHGLEIVGYRHHMEKSGISQGLLYFGKIVNGDEGEIRVVFGISVLSPLCRSLPFFI